MARTENADGDVAYLQGSASYRWDEWVTRLCRNVGRYVWQGGTLRRATASPAPSGATTLP